MAYRHRDPVRLVHSMRRLTTWFNSTTAYTIDASLLPGDRRQKSTRQSRIRSTETDRTDRSTPTPCEALCAFSNDDGALYIRLLTLVAITGSRAVGLASTRVSNGRTSPARRAPRAPVQRPAPVPQHNVDPVLPLVHPCTQRRSALRLTTATWRSHSSSPGN